MKKWILRTLIVLLVTGLVAGGIYLLVNKASANLPAGMELRGEGRPGHGGSLAPGDDQGEARPDGGKGLPEGLARPEGRRGDRDGFSAFSLGKSLLIVAGAVVLVSLIAIGARRLRRKPQPAAAPAAPIDAAPVESQPPAEPCDAAPLESEPPVE